MANDDWAVPSGSSPAARPDRLVPPHAAELRVVLPFGLPALIGAVASMSICYGTILAKSLFGIDKLGLNPHVQAVLMWGFALFAVYALWQDRKHHESNTPALLGTAAVTALILTLYVRYSGGVETLAYVVLVIAAFLNQTMLLNALNRRSREQTREIQLLNQRLERRVENQTQQIDRLARLKQFLAPQVADLVVSESNEALLDTHRRYIACLFCDIRGFTSLSESVEPEEVIALLQVYHDRVGTLVMRYRGTIGYRAGDGIMVFFNDPVHCDTPVLEAVKLGLDVRASFDDLRGRWEKRGHAIGIGLAIASGYATVGLVGFEGRTDYTAIGGVVNIASRLCDKALDGQILLTHRAYLDVEAHVRTKPLGPFELKGLKNAIDVHEVLGVREPSA